MKWFNYFTIYLLSNLIMYYIVLSLLMYSSQWILWFNINSSKSPFFKPKEINWINTCGNSIESCWMACWYYWNLLVLARIVFGILIYRVLYNAHMKSDHSLTGMNNSGYTSTNIEQIQRVFKTIELYVTAFRHKFLIINLKLTNVFYYFHL